MLTCEAFISRPNFADLASLERRGGALDAVVLGDDVAAAAQDQLGQQRAMAVEVAGGHVAQRADAGQNRLQARDAVFALFAAAVVFAAGELVMDHRIADHQTNRRVDRRQAEFEAAAVEQQGAVGGAVAGGELVHDAAAHADEFVLGALAAEREAGEIDGVAGAVEQGEAGRDLQRRRGTEAGADRHVAVDQQVGARSGDSRRAAA